MNQRLLAELDLDELFVQPAANDAGTSLGAATYVAAARGDRVEPLRHVYLGPEYGEAAIRAAL